MKAVISKILISFLAIVYALASFINPLHQWIETGYFYPLYRSLVSQGGVKTSDENIFYDFANTTEKIKRTDNIGKDATFSIKLAKNEHEGCQLSLVSNADNKQVSVKVSDFMNDKGDTITANLYRESYLTIRKMGDIYGDDFPDALIPIDETDVYTLEKDSTQSYYIEAISTNDTPAGEYTATVEISDGNGEVIAKSTITATVWNFALPDGSNCKTAIGLPGSTLFIKYGLPWSAYGVNTWLTFYDGSVTLSAEQERLYKQYYDYLLSYNLCANFLPYDILDERADAYMSNPKVTSFCIPYPKYDDAKLQAYYEKVCSNEVWRDKAYFYPVDEPFDSSRLKNFNSIIERLKRLCPGYDMIVPFGNYKVVDEDTGIEYTGIQMEENNVNMLCPISDYLSDKKFKSWYYDRVDNYGDKPWWYVCCGPDDDDGYCNLFTFQSGLKNRILFWQQKAYNIEGFLYYDAINWDFVDDPWTDPQTFGAPSDEFDMDEAGDGCFIYPGNKIGYDGPCGSLRLMDIADGIEDYDYLKMAEEAFGEKYVNKELKKVTLSLRYLYTSDDDYFRRVREEIGEKLSK